MLHDEFLTGLPMHTVNPEHYDITIIGAGMAGAAFAAAVTAKIEGARIAIVEARSIDLAEPGLPSYDSRSTVLSRGSALIFEELGLWPALRRYVSSVESIDVSDQGYPVTTLLNAADINEPALGYVIDNRALGQVLLRHHQIL